mgnify:CR=1 FL=1
MWAARGGALEGYTSVVLQKISRRWHHHRQVIGAAYRSRY